MLSARIVTVDYYLTSPIRGFDATYSKFRFSTVKQVPVIRVFGITSEGEKCCIHVHGVLPYLYVPYDGGGDVNALMSRLAIDLDRGINKAFSEPYQDSGGHPRTNKQYVFKVTPVSGIPFYGYHTKSHQFLKIYFYNPACIRKALALFEAGEVAGMTLQPFEAHVPYILQFFIDYNLYGMSFINISSFIRRSVELTSSQSIAKMTYCEVEGDVVADSITNRILAGCEPLLNPGLAGIWEDEKQRVASVGGFDPGGVFLPPDDPPEREVVRSSSDLTFLDKLLSAIQDRLEEANLGSNPSASQIGYPQETPDSSQLQSASFLDNHNITVSHLSQTLSTSNLENTVEQPSSPVLDALDMSLLRAIEEVRGIRAPLDRSGPDEDSILGSQPLNPDERDDEIADVEENFLTADDDSVLGSQLAEPEPPTDHDLDLTMPFSPPSPDDSGPSSSARPPLSKRNILSLHSPQVSQNSSRSLWEESFWSGCQNLSQLESDLTGHDVGEVDSERSDSEDIIFADGAFDDSDSSVLFLDGNNDSSDSDSSGNTLLPLISTPRKRGKQANVTPPSSRYTPLAVSVTKSPPPSSPSPRRVTRSSSRNPELLNKLRRTASLINKKIGKSPPKSDPNESSESLTSSEPLANNCGSSFNVNKNPSIQKVESRSSSSESSSEPPSLWKLSSIAPPTSKLKSHCLQQRNSKRKSCKTRAGSLGSLRIKVLKSSQSDSDSLDKFPESKQLEPSKEGIQAKITSQFDGNSSSDIVQYVKHNLASKGELINYSKMVPLQGILKKTDSYLPADSVSHLNKKCSLLNNRRESKDIFSDTSSDPSRSQNLEQHLSSQQSSASSPLAVTLSQSSDSSAKTLCPDDNGSKKEYIGNQLAPSLSDNISDTESKRAKKVLFSWESDYENSSSILSMSQDSNHHTSQIGVESFYETTMIKGDTVECIYARADPPPPVSSFHSLPSDPNLFPWYKNPRDKATSKEVGFDTVRLPSVRLECLEEFEGSFGFALQNALDSYGINEDSRGPVILSTPGKPPSYDDALAWAASEKARVKAKKTEEIDVGKGPTLRMAGHNDEEELDTTLTPDSILSQDSICTPKPTSGPKHSTPAGRTVAISPSITPISLASVKKNGNRLKKTSKLSQSEDPQKESQSPSLRSSNTLIETQFEAKSVVCNISESTPNNSGAFKMELQNLQDAHSSVQHRYLTLAVVEVQIATRAERKPDPDHDEIQALFYAITNDAPPSSGRPSLLLGSIIVHGEHDPARRYTVDCQVTLVPTEFELLTEFISLIRRHDPDLVAGYEIEMLSLGYIIQRGYILGLNLLNELGRVMGTSREREIDTSQGQEVVLPGRVVLNVWRIMRSQVALMSYSFENMAYHVLHTRVPAFSHSTFTLWWSHPFHRFREFVIKSFLIKVEGIVKILDQLDFIGTTSELASLFGIQFFEVLSRGSQFRVESLMLRQAKQLNYVPVSPSVKQRAHMRAPACLPLVMEPKSRFYGDPVIVLDFQSLYPSMMIAYNYCFSTCLGRVENLLQHERFEFGCTELRVPLKVLNQVKNEIHVSPAGVAFVSSNVKKGVLPKMLEEILNTRLMVKKVMKGYKDDKILQRVLHARQLGLKLIANVTYGYTSANFSGRMPCMEIGDSVVSKGRETLESVISMVNSGPWGARVVYGDTDSVFVLCPGRTRAEAFTIGSEIAVAASASHPHPVLLKLEKVYQPCILQTKKRYVGYMYESADQKEPVYDAKGIETVRRDGCPAVSKILEKTLRILFEKKDVSAVKDYVCRQMSRLFTGRINLQDVTFAKEYRGIHGYKPGACVPALKLARERLAVDRRAEPRSGERVGYVVVCGAPGLPLISLTRSPADLIADPTLRINAEYYILKAILPPLDRCFTLLGANVFSWYAEFPKKMYLRAGLHVFAHGDRPRKKGTISQFFASAACLLCGAVTPDSSVCSVCLRDKPVVIGKLGSKAHLLEHNNLQLERLCKACSGWAGLSCSSLDCPVLYRRAQARGDATQIPFIKSTIQELSSNSELF